MHRAPLQALLSRYQIFCSEDKDIVCQIERFVLQNKDCFERTLAEGHVTGSAWVVDATKSYTLLTHHRKLDKWFQLGGHADGDPDIYSVALREAQEESGLKHIIPLSHEIFDIDIHLIPGTPKGHYHSDVRFLFQADREEKLIVTNESKDLAWVRLDDLESVSQEPSVLRMKKKTQRLG
jgi:8-oxo-dGTP pyrophosphatase MutT (NUDIX family)